MAIIAKIEDVAQDFGIRLTEISHSKFDFKCKCPNKEHKQGRESTDSFFINAKNNDFYCFGCNISGNVIQFYMLLEGCDYFSAIEALHAYEKEVEDNEVKSEYKKIYAEELLELSDVVRTILKKNMIKNTEEFLEKLDLKQEEIKFDKDKIVNLTKKLRGKYL